MRHNRDGHKNRLTQEQAAEILGVDGRPGVRQLFADIPVQMCHFHQKQIITRYLTNTPKLEAGIELKKLTATLCKTNESDFTTILDVWHDTWSSFLKERTTDPATGRWRYTHKRLRSAYRSLRVNLSFLFKPALQKHRPPGGVEAVRHGDQLQDHGYFTINATIKIKLDGASTKSAKFTSTGCTVWGYTGGGVYPYYSAGCKVTGTRIDPSKLPFTP